MTRNFRCSGLAAAVLVLVSLLAAPAGRAATRTNILFSVKIAMTTSAQLIVPISTNAFVLSIKPGSFGTRDVVKTLSNLPSLRSNNLQNARLLYKVSNLSGGTGQSAGFILRSGTNDYDVSNNLWLEIPGGYVTSKAPGPNGTTNATDYGLLSLGLSGGAAGYLTGVEGFSIVKNTSIFNGRDLIQTQEFPESITASIAGSGYAAGDATIFKGTLVLSGRKVEIKEE